jgi:hypothetical protein
MSATCGADIVYPSGAPEITPGFYPGFNRLSSIATSFTVREYADDRCSSPESISQLILWHGSTETD